MLTLTRRVPRPSVALVVAFVALFAALGGTGYAALKITGKDIAKETITGSNVDNKSLGGKELKSNTLGGDQIKESALGPVPEALHAVNADNAQTAAKATDADTVGGIPAAQLMTQKPRAFEASIPAVNNFPNNSTLATLQDVPAGTYLVTARLNYYNPGGAAFETCTLTVPGSDDSSTFTVGNSETAPITLQEVVVSDSMFMPNVSCTSDGTDDIAGTGSLIAIRLD